MMRETNIRFYLPSESTASATTFDRASLSGARRSPMSTDVTTGPTECRFILAIGHYLGKIHN